MMIERSVPLNSLTATELDAEWNRQNVRRADGIRAATVRLVLIEREMRRRDASPPGVPVAYT